MSRKKREKRARARHESSPPVTSTGVAAHEEPERRETRRAGSINRLGAFVAIGGLVGLFALVVFLGEPPPPPPPSETASEGDVSDEPERSNVELWQAAFLQEIPVSERDYIRGPADAPVSIIEFSDFECPFCRIANTHLREVVERYPEDVRLVFKNFPLDMACNSDVAQQLHPYGCKAAVMARCASGADAGFFWRFHDAVFELEKLDDEALEEVASGMGADDEEFWSCVTGSDAFEEVREDIALARSLGVDATPTVFVNGRVAPSYKTDALSEVIDHILASK
jgi:protein-disulfide isomerase